MSRLDEKYSKLYLDGFRLKNIKSVVNLQESGEHEFCGKILESGFTYNPETLMAERINYFNFPTEDFGVWSPERLLARAFYTYPNFLNSNRTIVRFSFSEIKYLSFEICKISSIVDIVKVLSFALTEGAVAVHCHAGLGRTGVIIAALLIFENGISAEQSIRKGFIS